MPTITVGQENSSDIEIHYPQQPGDDVANYLGPWSVILENAGGYSPEAAKAAALEVLPDMRRDVCDTGSGTSSTCRPYEVAPVDWMVYSQINSPGICSVMTATPRPGAS